MKLAIPIALVIATVFAGIAQAASSRPAGMSKAQYRALIVRSEALNQEYGLGAGAVPVGMSAAEYRALLIRSEALNRKYALGDAARPVVSAPVKPTHGFGWGGVVFGIGAALGLVLIVAGFLGTRHVRLRSA